MESEAEELKLNTAILDTEVKRLKRLYSSLPAPASCQRTITICKNQSCRVMAFDKKNKMLVSVS